MTPADVKQRVVARAVAPYRSAGRFAYHFAKGKLQWDPAFTAILAQGLIPDRSRVVDLGCGQGLLAAWLLAARACHQSGQWCDAWPVPPDVTSLHGIELMPRNVERARRALGAQAIIDQGDIREVPFGKADTVVILDVLHYIEPAGQEAVLRRVRAALAADGQMLLRIGDANGGLRFSIGKWVDQTVLRVRGQSGVRLHCRPLADWLEVLQRQGFRAEARPMSAGTPFPNVLVVARPR